MKNIFKLLAILTAAVTLGSCSEEFIEKDKPFSMTEKVIFTNADYIQSALLGCYDVFKSTNPTFMGGLAYIVFDCRGEDIVNTSNPVTMQDTYEMRVLGTSTENGRIWNYAYGTINTCNIFIENLENYKSAEVIGAELCAQYTAEAKFIRAYCYYVLANLYSQPYCISPEALAVPLRLTALTSSGNNDCPAATIKAVYEQILADCIPEALPNAPMTRDGVTRASAGAAHMLRMRIYMAMKDWDKAIAEGKAVTGYSLDPDVKNLYGQDTYKSPEMIFALPMSTQDNPNTQMSCAEYFAKESSVSWLNTENGILSEADYSLAADKRISDLISTPDGSGYYYSLKFVDKAQKLDWIPVMRYAETLLNLAECYANKADGAASAKAALKEVRSRAIPTGDTISVDALSGGNLTTAVLKERRLEFICEGLRGVDIIRRGESFVKKVGATVDLNVTPSSTNYIWPVPDSEKKYNKTLGK
ncbi:MAG: RagB/SusD family nutrient uptake outer membrane protein [Bacteroidales bacterium]|nr:RagB/SusD family nutrient uptake outer membrane protein [Bacteroidales bacterium]